MDGLRIDEVKQVDECKIRAQSLDEMYKNLLETCAEFVSQENIPPKGLKPRIHKILTLGSGKLDALETSHSGHEPYRKAALDSLKRNAVNGARVFCTTQLGLMGMAPPHVELGDLVFFGARVPFILRSSGSFYTLIGEIYLGEGYMEGWAIDEFQAGTQFMESFELR
jgi:hypothetical protein